MSAEQPSSDGHAPDAEVEPVDPPQAEPPREDPGLEAVDDAEIEAALADDAAGVVAEDVGDDSATRVGEPVFRADRVTAGYLPGINILNDCSLELYAGELVGIIGPNGAGKSTLLKALFGLVDVRAGSITLNGVDVTNRRAHELVEAGIGYVPQTNNVFPSLTIEENLEMGLFLRPREFSERFAEIAQLWPVLADRRRQRAGGLSGGERQMVAMARALMMRPRVLLLDEPSAGLSPALQDEAFIRTRDINATGVSIVMVEQNARRCLQICHRAYVLDQGTNAYTGTGHDLLHDPNVISLYLGTLLKG